jgi:hypothetical protein
MFGILCKTLHGNILFSCPLACRIDAKRRLNIAHNALKNKDKFAIPKRRVCLCMNVTLANQLHHIAIISVPVFSLAC